MVPDPAYNIWAHTRETLFDLYARRARNELQEMTCHKQAAELLAPHLEPGMSVLDAGCGSGYLFWSFHGRGPGLEYYGIDYTPDFIELGRENIPARLLHPERLQVGAIEDVDGRFDAVVCINTLQCLPSFHMGLERLAQAASRALVLRAPLADRTRVRFETDDYLDEGYRGPDGLRSYFNIWHMGEVMDFLDGLGFEVRHVVDEWTGDAPEISAGKTFPWKFLFALRRNGG